MAIELRIPEAGESITEVRVGAWRKAAGEFVDLDEVVVEIETDKAAMELPAPVAGTLTEILKPEGSAAAVGDLIGRIAEGRRPAPAAPDAQVQAPPASLPPQPVPEPTGASEPRVMPAARRVLQQAGLDPAAAQPTGPGGRVLKEDALRAARAAESPPPVPAAPPAPAQPVGGPAAAAGSRERVVPMSPLRKVVARNLVAAQQQAALLSTFNEVDMSAVIELRQRYREAFWERHGVKLGFMSFFVKASVAALQTVPEVNARVDADRIVYRDYQDIGVAVGGGRGLVVPVLRDAGSMSFAEIERTIADFAARARESKIELSELRGGTFTISNGGIYGSMLSTPIVNPPQSGILGMHAIQDRAVVVGGQVVVRPMMYVALTYDHRIVDGREAVAFLKRIKDLVEHPERLWLQV